ncbi:MAG: hypothetical protein ACO1QB_02300 [Verrucomicrobiales bacterium]
MAKFSRKTKVTILGAQPVVLIAGLLSFACFAGLGYLWQVKQLHALGRQIKTSELKLEEVQNRKEGLQRGYAAMCSPRELEERIRFMKLGLVAPNPDTIVRLSDTPPPQMNIEGGNVLAGSTFNEQP